MSQTDLAREASVPLRTITRIEYGEVDPRYGTLERLLAECGQTLLPEAVADVDRSRILSLLKVAPMTRLRWDVETAWANRVTRHLGILASRGIRFVVVGGLAERLHGAPVRIEEPVIRVATAHSGRLRRALQTANTRHLRVGLTALLCSDATMESLLTDAWSVMVTDSRSMAVQSLDALIADASLERGRLLTAVRQEKALRGAGGG